MPVRILHVTQPVDGGVATVVRSLSAFQVGLGVEVHVASPGHSWLSEQLEGTGVRHHDWQADRSPARRTLGEIRALSSLLRSVNPDVVVLHSAKAGLAGRLAIRGAVPTVFVPHAWSFQAVDGVQGSLSSAWERYGSRWTDTLLCLSRAERDVGLARGVDVQDAAIVANGVDPDHYRPAAAAPARAALGLAPGPLCVCLGRLSRQKGQDRIVAAWPQIRERIPAAQLALVGDGPERFAMQQLAGPGVTLHGATSNPALWYQAADVVVVPSRWEGMALVPLEAMASGRSVVGYDVGGMRHVVDGSGVALPSDASVADLAAAVGERLMNESLATSEGVNGRRVVVERYDARQANRLMHEVTLRTAGLAG